MPIGLSGSMSWDQSRRSAASHCCFLPLEYSRSRSSLPSSYSQVNEVVVWPSTFHWVCSTGSRYRNWLDIALSFQALWARGLGGYLACREDTILTRRAAGPMEPLAAPQVERHRFGDLSLARVARDGAAHRVGRAEEHADRDDHERADHRPPGERHLGNPRGLTKGRLEAEPRRDPVQDRDVQLADHHRREEAGGDGEHVAAVRAAPGGEHADQEDA